MASQLSASLQLFIQKLDGLRDWPDKLAINEMSAITEKNIGFAEHFAKILVAKLSDTRTHSTYKLPVFYVIDSIMKHVGGPFAVLFGTYLAECYAQAVADLHDKDRSRLSFLLDTWTERKFMSNDLLQKMKQALNTSSVPVPVAAPRPAVAMPKPVPQPRTTMPYPAPTAPAAVPHRIPPAHGALPVAGVAPPLRAAPMPMPMPAPAALPVPLSGPAATLQTRLAPAAADPLAAGMFADLVQNEMVTMLNQMYAEMNVTNPMSLEQLAAANPSLHAQIRAKAEETARAVMAQRKLSASPVQAAGGGGGYAGPSRGPGYYPPVASPQAVYPAQPTHAAVAGRKRAADYPDQYATQSGVYRGAPSEGFGPAGAGRYPPAQQQYPSQVQYSSRFNAPIAGARSTRPYPGNNGYPPSQAPAYNYPRATGPSPQFPARDSRELDLDEEELSPEQEEAEHAELLRRRAEESRYYEELRVKYASDHFVNGFLSEAPVVVDVARVQALHDVLRSQYCNQTHIDNNDIVGDASRNVRVKIEGAESKTSTSSAVDSGSAESKSEGEAVKLSEGFRAASHTVTQRLGSYLRDIQTPPRLPQILFGPLPLVPIYGVSAEAQDEQARIRARDAATAAGAAIANQGAQVRQAAKIPIPPFRVEELGRNPEKMVHALYAGKPHQFHEDGLRFKTLSELKQHTDKHMEVKKLLLKRTAVREYRDWYCTSAQWVTDFSALGLASGPASSASASSSSGAGTGAAGSTSAQRDTQEEFILPADEHFTRCPVSREVFECVWDAEEGEMMYRHAVKVLVSEAADAALYPLAQPVPWEGEDGTAGAPVRYLIVHERVLNQWLAAGKAVPLKDAVIRYKTLYSGAAGQAKADKLMGAVGQDDDEDDVFVLLEFGNGS